MTANMHPQMQAVLEKNAENGAGPAASAETVGALRAHYLRSREFWNQDAPEMAAVSEHQVTAPAGAITVRLYRPEKPFLANLNAAAGAITVRLYRPVANGGNLGMSTAGAITVRLYRPVADGKLPLLLFCHGGGFIYGNLDSHDNICRQLASRSGWAVLAIDYHLAPEHKFPTPLADVSATIAWLDDAAEGLGLDTGMMAAGGDSAGASIMLGVAMDLRQSRPDLLKQLLLIYGNYGLGDESHSMQAYGGGDFGLGPELRKFFRGSYLGQEADWQDPRIAALKADLSGLPPVLALAAEMDPLHDNSPALVEKLRAIGISAESRTYQGMLHGFAHYTRFCDASVRLHDDAAAALRSLAAAALAA